MAHAATWSEDHSAAPIAIAALGAFDGLVAELEQLARGNGRGNGGDGGGHDGGGRWRRGSLRRARHGSRCCSTPLARWPISRAISTPADGGNADRGDREGPRGRAAAADRDCKAAP